jgi:hypothetical protein
MKKLVEFSPMVKEGIIKGDLGLCGACYDIYTGDVEWLGDHPDLETLTGSPLPYWIWKNAKYARDTSMVVRSENPKVEAAIQKLRRGNERFKDGMFTRNPSSPEVPDPFAIVIGGGEVRVPIEQMFDVQPGELIVQVRLPLTLPLTLSLSLALTLSLTLSVSLTLALALSLSLALSFSLSLALALVLALALSLTR